jgi:hypothetical protein
MIKLEGFDELQRIFAEAQEALKKIHGELGAVSFDPNSSQSVEAAIFDMEKLIDDRMRPYSKNEIIKPLIESTKEAFRNAILDQARDTKK